MKEEWLMSGAMVPVDMETTAALVAEIKRLINVVGGLVLQQGPDYERGFVDGMQKQMQSSVDKAVNAMAEQDCVGWFSYDTGLRLWFEANKGDDGAIPLYKGPQHRPWVGLTDDEIKEIVGPWGDTPIKGYTRELIDKIEAKLRSKN
jgi:hypothetical protein